MVPHSYALRVHGDLPSFGDAALVFYLLSPKTSYEYGESEELWSLVKSCLRNGDTTDIFSIKNAYTQSHVRVYISYVNRQDRLLNADVHLAQDSPQNEDFTPVSLYRIRALFSTGFALVIGMPRALITGFAVSQTQDADVAPPTRVIN